MPRRLVHVGCFGVFLAAFTLVVGLGFWLRVASSFLVVGDRLPAKADAIVVLGGGDSHGSRELRAAELYLAGMAPLVVTTGGPVAGAREVTYAEWSIDRLVRRGVPRGSVVATYTGASTASDAMGALALSRERGWSNVVFVTDEWHTRRAALVISSVFGDAPVRAYISGANDPNFLAQSWWLDETSALILVSEYIKLLAFYVGPS